MQLPDTLVEKLLAIFPSALNREGDITCPLNRPGGVPGSLVERFSLMRVAGLGLLLSLVLGCFLREDRESTSEQCCQQEKVVGDHGANTNTNERFLQNHSRKTHTVGWFNRIA